MKPKGSGATSLKSWKKKYRKSQILYPAKIFFKDEGEGKTYFRHRKLKEYVTKDLHNKNIKEVLQVKRKLSQMGIWNYIQNDNPQNGKYLAKIQCFKLKYLWKIIEKQHRSFNRKKRKYTIGKFLYYVRSYMLSHGRHTNHTMSMMTPIAKIRNNWRASLLAEINFKKS